MKDRDGLDLCLKIIAPGSDTRYVDREIEALQKLNHKNLARLHLYEKSFSAAGFRHCIIEYFIAGDDLTAHLDGTPWDQGRAVKFFGELLDGLAQLDSIPIVHRDLKPSNIRIHRDGYPVIIDFGLARHLSLSSLTQTSEGARKGTPIYFAPEQWDGTHKDIDVRTDLFAVGILLYQALLGRHPFYSKSDITADELRRAVCEANTHLETEDFKALPSRWRMLLGKLLERNKEKRPLNAAQTAKAIRAIGGAA